MIDKRYQVFVSSTYEDLLTERKAVMEALLQMNCIPIGMEYFNASDESQWEVIKQLINECDYYVLIVAGRYGSIDVATGKSYTQQEFEYAKCAGLPVISFLYDDSCVLPESKIEQNGDAKDKLQRFKEDVKMSLCRFWSNSGDLAAQVVLSLNNLIKSKPRVGWVKADQLDVGACIEILRLREQIDALNTKIHEIEDKVPDGIDDLQQGEDKMCILYTSNLHEKDIKVNVSWNRIISSLAPHLIRDCSETQLKVAINDMVRSVEKRNIDTHSLSDDSFQTIKVQLIALGIIKLSKQDHTAKDLNTYWVLTSYGYKKMMWLKAIKKQQK